MDNSAGYCPRPRNHSTSMGDPAHFRMSFGMMLASPGREDRLYGPPGASALGRLDMVVEASYAVSAGRIRFRTKRPVRSLNTAYDGVLSIM